MANRPVPLARLEVLDWFRGLALLGMFVVHFHVRSTEPGGFDDVVRLITWRLVESKSHGTFALLFGAGFALLMRRADASGQSITGRYLRRLAALAVFGGIAHACFGFNVLVGYAVWGLPLLLIRRWSTRALVAVALLSVVSVMLYRLGETLVLTLVGGTEAVSAASAAQDLAAEQVTVQLDAAEAQASYRVLLAARLRHMAWFYTQPFSFLPSVTLALFISGFLLVRHRVFDDAAAHSRFLGWMIAFGVVSWLAANWLLPGWGVPSLGLLRDQWLTFSYVGAGLLLVTRAPDILRRSQLVSSAGRMALTNYLVQIAALDLLFSGYALGLGTIRPVIGVGAALVCFLAEAVFSALWLRHFQFGPAEWLWRSITYGRRQPIRRESPALAA